MAKITLNPMIEEAHGRMGNAVFRRTHSGGMSLIKVADMSRVKWSDSQKAHRQRFKQAVAYAKAAMAHPPTRHHYEAIAQQKTNAPMILPSLIILKATMC